MAKVSLRIYNREIESLIDQGRLDEAIAHCRHILQTFPKHLETYRLLGKAYLESKRYNEAVDIFNRVLMAVPDDFVANVGLSIIRDEENQLDDAIWHMERAFEAQPSNAAIQAEMQRLYGRRDGVEPPKIRMTRGALAHMYVQGELYPQAISEIRAVLSEDPQRADMQVLLARAFFKGGQKADASDMCAQLLKRYPYCFDANRIMVELLPASERAESTQVYRHRVNELDPYSMFAKESVFHSSEVPDASINLERLEYTGEELEGGQEWAGQLGSGLASTSVSSDQPEWLTSGFADLGMEQPSSSADQETFDQSSPAGTAQAGSVPESKSDSDIPDFLRQAGWTESSGAVEEPGPMDSSEEEGLTPASIPDWLKGQMPAETSSERKTVPPMAAETPDWLSGLGAEQPEQPQTSSEAIPDWLGGSGASQPTEPETTKASEVPDWLSNLGGTESAEPTATPQDAPDWLSKLDSGQPEQPTPTEAAMPDWLSSTSIPEEQEPEPAKPAPSVESLGASAKEQDDAIAWLEMLAAKHGAKPEELVTDPAKRSEKPPEWVEQARALAESQPSAPESNLDETGIWLRELETKETKAAAATSEEHPLVGAGETPDWLSGMESKPAEEAAPTAEEEPLAEAQLPDWLSGLDQLSTEATQEQPPAQETSEPDWRTRQKNLPRTRPLDEAALTHQANVPDWLIGMEDESEEPPAQKDIAEWLSGLDQELESKPSAESTDLPEWLSGLDKEEEKPAPEAETVSKDTELPDWLSGLESPPAGSVEEKQEEAPAAEAETVSQDAGVPDWLSGLESPAAGVEEEQQETTALEKDTEVPEWLSGLEAPAVTGVEEEQEEAPLAQLSETEEPAPAEATPGELPEWLRGLEQPEAEKQAEPTEDVPSWLKGDFEEEEPHPAEVTPADWHPAEPRPEPPIREPEPQVEAPEPAPEAVSPPREAQFVPPPPDVRKPVQTPVTPSEKPAKPVRIKQAESAQVNVTALHEAQKELNRGDIPAALNHYLKLIKKGKHLDETIRHLRDSLYRYPVEVGIWQTLGDAYMRANRLQEALDAYNKAEELLR